MFRLCRSALNIASFIALALLAASTASTASAADEPIPVRIVVAAMFERGEISGDEPGELQLWLERLPFNTRLSFPQGRGDIHLTDDGVMALLLGGGIANATATAMALGNDDRFDLRHAYWLIAGIAGGDPQDLSLGSAAWAKHVVDGDLAYEIDGREIPAEWPYGMVPLGGTEPADDPRDLSTTWTLNNISFELNADLVDWAWSITRQIDLGDSPGIREYRQLFDGFDNAQKPPFVTIGDTLSASTYWHGRNLNVWANDWVKLYAGADANFMTSNMEDSGTLTALQRLADAGRVDMNRILVLRTVSNYTMPPPGKSAQWSRTVPYPDSSRPSLEAAFVVGNRIVQALLDDWDRFKGETPTIGNDDR
ncbi:MAG: purine nucleoside permease [Gammaproteobacteria bacterium]|nr:purine nucleoside permease [Gammaproteobacteria bacterium]